MTTMSSTRRAVVAALVVALALVFSGTAAAAARPAAETRVATHHQPTGPPVAASDHVSPGQRQATTTPAAKEATGSRVAPQTTGDDCGGGDVLYHYTSAAGMAGILACECINASSGSTNARHGDGAYFTDLAPEGVTGTTPYQLSRALYGIPWNASRVTNFVAVDASRVAPPPTWVAPLNSNRYPGSIYLSPSTTVVSIAGAVRRSGAVPF